MRGQRCLTSRLSRLARRGSRPVWLSGRSWWRCLQLEKGGILPLPVEHTNKGKGYNMITMKRVVFHAPAAVTFYLSWGGGLAAATMMAGAVYVLTLVIYVMFFASWIPRTGGYSGCDDGGGPSFSDMDTESGGLTSDLVYYEEVISNKD